MHLPILLGLFIQIAFMLHAIKTNKSFNWLLFLLIPWIGSLFYFFIKFLPETLQNQQPFNTEKSLPKQPDTISQLNGKKIVYLTQGKLFHKCDALPLTQISSHFGQKVIDKTLEAHRRNEWKTENTGSPFGGSTLWGANEVNADAIKVDITSVARSDNHEKLYFLLETESTGGLFVFDYKEKDEKRLFHKEKFHAKDLDLNEENDKLVCSRRFANGTANIMVMDGDGSNMSEVTAGDSVDEAPSWVAGEQNQIIFQSSGIARNREGYALGTGPSALQLLDVAQQKLSTVLEDSKYDFLQPHVGPDGSLYFIRRPYETNQYNDEAAFIDFFLFPFRLVRAVFHYLNFFSLIYSKKPLTTAAGPVIKGDDIKNIILKGKVINAEKAMRKGTSILGVPSLVPSSWELVKRDRNGHEKILAKSILAFDIHSDGTIAYSNGYGIFTLDAVGKSKLVVKDNLIEEIAIS